MIIHEITRAGTSATWGHFGCIFKATAECAMRNVTLVCVLCADNGHLTMAFMCDLGGEKKNRATMRMVMAMAMCEFMRG
jgi:hypothetical protein